MAVTAFPCMAGGRSLDESGCIASRIVHDGLIRILDWRCIHESQETRQTREHQHMVMIFPQVGACHMHCEGRTSQVDPTRAQVILPETLYKVSHPYGVDDRGVSVALQESLALELLEHYLPARLDDILAGRPLRVLATSSPVYASLLFRLLGHWSRIGIVLDGMMIEEIALEGLRGVLRNLRDGDPGTPPIRLETEETRHQLVEDTRSLLMRDLGESLTLGGIARRLSTSPAHLTRLFRQATGLPLYRYLRYLRLEVGLSRLLWEPRTCLQQIALECGFASHSHFTHAFREVFSLTPHEIRRMARYRSSKEIRQGLSHLMTQCRARSPRSLS